MMKRRLMRRQVMKKQIMRNQQTMYRIVLKDYFRGFGRGLWPEGLTFLAFFAIYMPLSLKWEKLGEMNWMAGAPILFVMVSGIGHIPTLSFMMYLIPWSKGRREEYVQKMLHVEILVPIGITLLWDIAAFFIQSLSVYVFIMQMVSVLVTTYIFGALNNKGNMYGEENRAVYGKDVTLAGVILCLCSFGAVIMFVVCTSQVDRRDFILILSLQILLSLPGVVWIKKRWKTIRARIADYETAVSGKDSAHI